MELPDLDNISTIRKKVKWTQKDLAEKSGVSQSMIAKIEKGSKKPSYDTAQKLFGSLSEELASKQSYNDSKQAKDIATMAPILVYLSPDESVESAIEKLGNNFDQLPVLKDRLCVGTISTKIYTKIYIQPELKSKKVKEVMGDPLPIVSEDTPVSNAQKMLEVFNAILISKKGEITGIITRSDLIKNI